MQSKHLKLAFTVAGTVIGAGFATGKELLLFFKNDALSFFCLLFSILLMAVISLIYFSHQKGDTYCPNKTNLLTILFLLFSAASYTVMLACGGEALHESVRLPFFGGSAVTFVISLCIVYFGTQNVYRFNMLATPVLLVCMIGISLAGLLSPVGLVATSEERTVNLLLYSGYNLLSVLPVVGALSDTVTKQEGTRGIILGFFLVAAAGLLLQGFLLRFSPFAEKSAIPVLSAVSHLHESLEILYTVMLYLSVLTTAVNALFAVTKGHNPLLLGLLLFICSFLGFTVLIETLYPLFGYLGIGVIIIVVINLLKTQKKERM